MKYQYRSLCVLFISAIIVSPVCAEPSSKTEQAMEDIGYVNWYDPETRQLRPVAAPNTDGGRNDSKNRTEGIAGPTTNNKFSNNFNWADFFSALGWGMVWGLVALAILLVIVMLISGERRRRVAYLSDDEYDADDSETAERLERLPVEVRKPTSNLLGEAQALMEAGNYNEAIIYLFSHQLVQLDKHQLLRLTRGKTNRQYLREIRSNNDLQNILRDTVYVFEDAFFGDHTITRERFSECWNSLDQFHGRLKALASVREATA